MLPPCGAAKEGPSAAAAPSKFFPQTISVDVVIACRRRFPYGAIRVALPRHDIAAVLCEWSRSVCFDQTPQ
jgi:hypothetical protein